MAEPLSPADRSALSAEQGPVSMAVGGLMVLEGGPGLEPEAFLERVRSRLHLLPRYRQRLQTTAGVLNPVWIDDDGFELGWHVRRASLGAEASDVQLADFVGREMSRRLDRSRPLWELTVVDGLADGHVAVLSKMHHALVDGMAAVDIGTVLLDPGPEPLELPPPEEQWEPKPYDRSRHLTRLGMTPAVIARRLLQESGRRALTPDPRRAAKELLGATELLTELARTKPSAPMTSLNRPIGPNRRYAFHRVELAALKAAGKAAGGTVNDAILAVVAGALRRALPDLPAHARPVALVPVSVRVPGQEGGNRISTVLVELPIGSPDPVACIAEIHASTQKLKDSATVRAGAFLVNASGWAPPLISSSLAWAMSNVRAFNVVVSNVPGPQQPFYIAGSRMLGAYPAVPLNPSTQGVTVGVLSYDGGVHFGLLADRDLEPPLEIVMGALRASADALLAG